MKTLAPITNLTHDYFDGEAFITLDVIEVNYDSENITLAISNRGRITISTYDLSTDRDGDYYFEYGNFYEKIYLNDFYEYKGELVI